MLGKTPWLPTDDVCHELVVWDAPEYAERGDGGDVCGHPRWLHSSGECYGCHVAHIISFDIADDPSRYVVLPHHEFVSRDGKRRNGWKKPPARAQVYPAREACTCTRETPDWQPAEPRPLRR